jgi:hypothetical protein
MNREPGETAEQWKARTTARYERAEEALEVESERLELDSWRFRSGTYSMLDEAYDKAMDELDAADDERPETSRAPHFEILQRVLARRLSLVAADGSHWSNCFAQFPGGGGSIVGVASTDGLLTEQGLAAYCTSKVNCCN